MTILMKPDNKVYVDDSDVGLTLIHNCPDYN